MKITAHFKLLSCFGIQKSLFFVFLGVFLGIFLFNAGDSYAQTTRTWNGTADSNWFNPANWSGNAVPGTNDVAQIGFIQPFNNQPTLDGTTTIRRLVLGSNNQTLSLTANTVLNINEDFVVGTSGTFDIGNGTVNVGTNVTTQGNIIVDGGTINFAQNFTYGGSSTLTVETGIINVGTESNPANFRIQGNVTVNLNAATVNVSGNFAHVNSVVNAGSSTISVGGDFEYNGGASFNAQNSTVSLSGSPSSLFTTSNKSIVLNNLVIDDGADVTADMNVTVTNFLTQYTTSQYQNINNTTTVANTGNITIDPTSNQVEAVIPNPGTGTFIVPVNVNEITVEAWGAGGGGGPNGGSERRGGGGGGAYARSVISVQPGDTFNFTVGAGGTPGSGGGASIFGSPILVQANGGSQGGNNGGSGGAAASSVGDVRFSGGDGGARAALSSGGGGGGGSAFSNSDGNSGGNGFLTFGGSGGTGEGNGGDGGNLSGAGENGQFPGGGGGGRGSSGGTSGTGGNGLIIITYEFDDTPNPDPNNTTITVDDTVLFANGFSTTLVTVAAFDADNNPITEGGNDVTISTTVGTLSSVTDNNDGTYTAILTAPTSPGTATITGTIDSQIINDTAEVIFVEFNLVYYPGGLDNSNLLIWLDADDDDFFSLNGNNVSQWFDKSPNGNHASQSNQSLQPEFVQSFINGRSVVQYSQGDALLTGLQPSGLNNGVSVSIVNRTAGSGDRGYFGSWDNPRVYLMNRSGQFQTGFGNDWELDGTFPENEFIATSLYSNGSTSLGFIEGNQIHTYNSTFSGTNSNVIGIGTTNGVSGRDFTGELGEIVFFNRNLNLTERTIIDNYLNAKWGLGLDTSRLRFSAPLAFGNQLVGIGRETASDNVIETVFSSGGLGLLSSTSAGNFLQSNANYLMAAHNNLTGEVEINAFTTWERVWYIEKTLIGNDGTLEIYFDFEDYGLPNPSPSEDYFLIFHPTDPGFPLSGLVEIDDSPTVSGSRVIFNVNSSDIANGYYTIGRPVPPRVFFSIADGDWDDATTWSNDSYTGPQASFPPRPRDTVFIGAGYTVSFVDNVLTSASGEITIEDTGTLNTAGFTLSGPGIFTLDGGGTLTIASPDGITDSASSGAIQTATRNFSEQANYVYNGTDNQTTGDGLPETVNDLIVNNSGNEVTAVISHRVNGQLELAAGTFVMSSGTSLVALDVDDSGGGELRMERLIDGNKGWRMVASPVATTFSDLFDGFVTQGFTGSGFPNLQPNILWFNETIVGTTNMAWRQPGNSSESIVGGRGFYQFVFDGAERPDAAINYPDELPITMTATGLEFATGGNPFNFGVTFTERDPGTITDTDIVEADQGWNMIGNPSTATLDWDATGWTRTNIDETIYIWDPSANSGDGEFLVHNSQASTTLSGSLIAPFQAFWVVANGQNPVLEMTDAVKTTGGEFIGDTALMNTSEAPFVLNMNLSNNKRSTEAVLLFSEYGKTGKDTFDAYRLTPLTDSYLMFFSMRESDSMPLVINSLPNKFDDTIILPVHVGGLENGTPVNGEFVMSWGDESEIPQGLRITLMDHEKQKAVSLRKETEYIFWHSTNPELQSTGPNERDTKSVEKSTQFKLPEGLIYNTNGSIRPELMSGEKTPRFTLVIDFNMELEDLDYIPLQPELAQNYPNPFNPSTTIRFSLPAELNVTLEVYDILGRRIASLANGTYAAGTHTVTWDARNQASGIYLYRLQAGDRVVTRKMTLIK